LVYDALTRVGLLAPIPRGILGALHQVGGAVSDANLAAAVWEDGGTYGPDNLLLRISSSRRELADSYDRTIAEPQTGLEKNWTAEDYLAAAQPLKPPMDAEKAATPATFTAKIIPSHRITDNMQRAAQENHPPPSFGAGSTPELHTPARFSAAGARRINCLRPAD